MLLTGSLKGVDSTHTKSEHISILLLAGDVKFSDKPNCVLHHECKVSTHTHSNKVCTIFRICHGSGQYFLEIGTN